MGQDLCPHAPPGDNCTGPRLRGRALAARTGVVLLMLGTRQVCVSATTGDILPSPQSPSQQYKWMCASWCPSLSFTWRVQAGACAAKSQQLIRDEVMISVRAGHGLWGRSHCSGGRAGQHE